MGVQLISHRRTVRAGASVGAEVAADDRRRVVRPAHLGGAGLVVGGKASDLAEGIALAQQQIDSGAAAATLERFISASQEAAA